MEGRGEMLLPACWEFLTFNLLFVLVGFLLLRWIARKLKGHKVVKLLKPFSLGLYLSPLLLEGNLQYLCFLLFSQVSNSFSLSPRDKAFNVLNYLIFFIVIWVSVVSGFLAFWMSRKLAHYLLDNWKTRLRGLLAHCLTNTIRMFIIGAIHSLLRSHPAQLPLLLSIELLYIFFLIFFSSYWKMH